MTSQSPEPFQFVATAPRGLSDLAATELAALGAAQVRERPAGVLFRGSLEVGYRACLWSRVASRILLQLTQFNAVTAEDFYAGVCAVDWREHIDPARSIACEFTGSHPAIGNTHFGALRLKDGICDQLRAATGTRPDVALSRPAVRLHAHANGAQVTLSLDLAGEGLHRRGYRQQAGEAPLRENVAAGLLLRAGWRELAARGGEFLDPMCGAGTLVIEAAMIAADRAPGLRRDYFGFYGWRAHDAALWQRLLEEAEARVLVSVPNTIRGTDIDARVLQDAAANARHAGIAPLLNFEASSVSAVRPATRLAGLVCTNPPYGVRLGDEAQANAAYRELGAALREHFSGWEAAILAATPEASRELRLRNFRTHKVWNGAIECRLLRVDLSHPGAAAPAAGLRTGDPALAESAGARMFANRLEKNLKRLGREARRGQVSCFRLYDADMPEYAFAIDRYQDASSGELHIHVQEYAPPASIEPEAARRRRAEALAVLPATLEIPVERIHLRVRRRQSGDQQYTKLGEQSRRYVVEEAGLKFLVNFDDYLDTGLFLDQRLTRAQARAAATDARFLNLFCYTGSATVYAAAGGARVSNSVDLSNTYLDWAADNLKLNGFDMHRHVLERADCREWLVSAAARRLQYDLIFLDPPTFSNSKRMQGVLDVQRDHAALIGGCMQLLAPAGLLLFSTNAQRFKLDVSVAEQWSVKDISARTIPFDFKRNSHIHRCFEIRQWVSDPGR